MAKKYYMGARSVPTFSTNPKPTRVYTLRVLDGVVYGLDSRPYNYLYRWSSGSSYRAIFAELTATRVSTTEHTLCTYGSVSAGNSPVFYAFDEDATGYGNAVSTSALIGRYKIKQLKAVNFSSSVYYDSGVYTVPIIIDFTINETLYKGFIINGSRSSYTFTGSSITLIKQDESVESYSIVNFCSVYDGAIIQFDSTDIMPLTVVNWWKSITEEVYPYSYTINSFDGEAQLAQLTESPPMTVAILTTIGNQKTLTLTGSNGQTYTMQWESETPEGKMFLGLSASPNSNRPTLLANTETAVSWTGDLVFYESYGTYRPPTTVFDINLYQNTAEVNRVDKGTFLTGVGTLSGALREECSILTPSIVYQSSDVPTFNYVYIPIFNRYYFVTSLSSVGKNLWRMELNCDVLMTYKDSIFLLQGVVARQQFDFNEFLIDDKLPAQKDATIEFVNTLSTTLNPFDTQKGFTDYIYVLTVVG